MDENVFFNIGMAIIILPFALLAIGGIYCIAHDYFCDGDSGSGFFLFLIFSFIIGMAIIGFVVYKKGVKDRISEIKTGHTVHRVRKFKGGDLR